MKSNIRAMTSIRMGATRRRGAACWLCAAALGVERRRRVVADGHDQRRIADPGSTKAATQQFDAQVAEFEKANPTIKVNSVQYQWTGPTFAAKLAAGTLPTVFTVPFTDARTLGDNGQLADLTQLRQGAAVLQRSSTRR